MIYTIGYSTRTLTEFLATLKEYEVEHIIDVRSRPWSRNAPFNYDQIIKWAKLNDLGYEFCGEILGGQTTYPIDHKRYLESLEQILDLSTSKTVAIMCAEGHPQDCHRTWDVGASILIRWGELATSIKRDGTDECIMETLRRVKPSNFNPIIKEEILQVIAP